MVFFTGTSGYLRSIDGMLLGSLGMTVSGTAKMKPVGLLEAFVGVLMSLLVMDVFVQVVLRYVTYQPLAWTEEIARLLFVWICLIGAAIGVKRGTHFSVSILVDNLPARVSRIFNLGIRIMEASFYAVLMWSGVIVTRVAHRQHSPSLEYPMSLSYSAIAISGALMCIFSLWRVYKALLSQGDRV